MKSLFSKMLGLFDFADGLFALGFCLMGYGLSHSNHGCSVCGAILILHVKPISGWWK